MGFQSYNGALRRLGRRLVLPEKEIKEVLIRDVFSGDGVNSVVDFGAGTLVWSEWFKNWVDLVYAIDVIFKEGVKDKIKLLHGIEDVDEETLSEINGGGMLWMCDVLHHIDFEFSIRVLDCFSPACKYIVLKDVDCRHRFGDFMNRIHDRIINGENVRDIDPAIYEKELNNRGFKTTYYYFRKLWYPHFLIVAKKY